MPDDVTVALAAWQQALRGIELWHEQIEGTYSVPRVPQGEEIPYREHPLGDDPLTTAKINAMSWPARVQELEEVVAAIRRIDDVSAARRHLHDHAKAMRAFGEDVERTLTDLTTDLKKLDELPRPLSGSMRGLNETLEHWIGFGDGVKLLVEEAVEKSLALIPKTDGAADA